MVVLQIFAISLTASALLERYAPQYSIGLIWSFLSLLSVQLVAYFLYITILYPRYFSPLRHVPTAPGWEFMLGHTRKVIKEPSGRPAQQWIESVPHDGLIRYSMWFRERLLITSPKTLGEVLVTKNYDFIKPYNFRFGLGRILGIGILLAEGEEHKIQRKNLSPAFAYRHIKDLYPVFWGKSRELLEALSATIKASAEPSEQKEDSTHDEEKASGATDEPTHRPDAIEVGDFSSRVTLDIIGVSGMGQDFGALQDKNSKLNELYRMMFNPGRGGVFGQILALLLPVRLLTILPFKRNFEINAGAEYIKQVCRDLIAQKRKQISEKGRTDVDILSVALDSGGFTDEDLVNQMMTFLVAGHETTATAMTWSMYLLCKHPDIQKKLREEVRKHIPSPDSDVTAADFDNCHYLRAVCNEILRLWPPVTLTIRVTGCDTSINGQFVPKDTVIILAPWAINTSVDLWGPDAKEFKPERWLDADGKANNKGSADSNFSFLTFLHGPRSCIGQKFAQAEFECLLAAWVGRFETEFEEGTEMAKGEEPEVKGGVTSKPKNGMWVTMNQLEGW